MTAPGYTIPERGARFAGGDVVPAAADANAPTSCPTWTRVDPETWERAAILWLNYPNNPTGAVAPLAFLRDAAELARTHDVPAGARRGVQRAVVRRRPAGSALQVGDLTNVIVLNTLASVPR